MEVLKNHFRTLDRLITVASAPFQTLYIIVIIILLLLLIHHPSPSITHHLSIIIHHPSTIDLCPLTKLGDGKHLHLKLYVHVCMYVHIIFHQSVGVSTKTFMNAR